MISLKVGCARDRRHDISSTRYYELLTALGGRRVGDAGSAVSNSADRGQTQPVPEHPVQTGPTEGRVAE